MKVTKTDLILLLMVTFWGANISIIKVLLRDFQPVVLNCLRFALASATMLFLYRDVFKDPVSKHELWGLFLLGILGNTIYQFLFIFGVKYTMVSHTSILLGTTPIFTAAMSSLMGYEKVRPRLWMGIALSFTGVVLIVFGSGQFELGGWYTIIGDVFVILASFVWSIYTTFSKKVVTRYSSRHYIVYTVLFGTIFLVPFSLPALRNQNWAVITLFDWLGLAYSAFLALVFGYSAWYYGVQKIGSTRTSAYSNLTPVAGLIIAMIFLHERLAPLQWLGAAVIFTGLALNRFSQVMEVST